MNERPVGLTVIVPVIDWDAGARVVELARSAGSVDEPVYIEDGVRFVKARFASEAAATSFEVSVAAQMRHSFRPVPVEAVLDVVGSGATVYHSGSIFGGGIYYEGVVRQVDEEHIRVMPFALMGGLLSAPPPHADVRIDLVRDIQRR